jgi:hypothetical protein
MKYNDDERIATAPLPTQKTLRFRKSVPRQLIRFLVINVLILSMVHKAHES